MISDSMLAVIYFGCIECHRLTETNRRIAVGVWTILWEPLKLGGNSGSPDTHVVCLQSWFARFVTQAVYRLYLVLHGWGCNIVAPLIRQLMRRLQILWRAVLNSISIFITPRIPISHSRQLFHQIRQEPCLFHTYCFYVWRSHFCCIHQCQNG
jgi:hypothetical protein